MQGRSQHRHLGAVAVINVGIDGIAEGTVAEGHLQAQSDETKGFVIIHLQMAFAEGRLGLGSWRE